MPTPLHLKPPMAAWIARERHRLGLKPRDVAARLSAMGLDVTEATVKVWESNADRRPSPYNRDGLERLFESRAPEVGTPGSDQSGVTAALLMQAAALSELAAEIRLARAEEAVTRQEMMRALAALASGRALQETPGAVERGIPVGEPR